MVTTWIYNLENYGYVALAFGQRQVLLSLFGFLLLLALTWVLRRQSVQSLLLAWLCFWIWMLPFSLLGSTNPAVGIFSRTLYQLRETAQRWLPQAISPCDVAYVDRISGDLPFVPQLSWHKLLLSVWLLIAAYKAVRVLWRRSKLSTTAKTAHVIDEPEIVALAEAWRQRYRLSRTVSVRSSSEYSYAFTIGVLRPVIFLPDRFLHELSFNDIDAVLGHEFAHIKRYDDFVLRFQLVTKCLLFFNPLIWLSARRIAVLRECRCDQLAIQAGKLTAKNYAESLLRVAELQRHRLVSAEPVAKFISSALTERIHSALTLGSQHFSYIPLLAAITGLLSLNIIFMPNLPQLNAIRGDAAKILFNRIGAVAPMARLQGSGNFIDGGSNACGLPARDHYHPGADFVAAVGGDRSVHAIADGEITTLTDVLPNVGITVQIKHGKNMVSTYVHLDAVNVKSGDHVHAGQRIGTLGDGHLHVEVRKDSRVVDPSVLLATDLSGFDD